MLQTSKYFRPIAEHLVGELPKQMNFPFVVDVHPLCAFAIEELKHYLQHTNDFEHDFGIEEVKPTSIGKMFGVLVVQKSCGAVGYLSAYSGKLANSNWVSFFVPPVFDMLQEDGFFLKEETELNAMNAALKSVEEAEEVQRLQRKMERLTKDFEEKIAMQKATNRTNKQQRKQWRAEQRAALNEDEYAVFEQDMIKQSLYDKHQLSVLRKNFEEEKSLLESQKFVYELYAEQLKQLRKERSHALQNKLFASYCFLNAKGEKKDLLNIFEGHTFGVPPAGAGECCAPKLLQFAYLQGWKPLAMAEFWWGASPKSEVRKHGQVYPACWGKCEPILGHMLEGVQVKPSPFLENPAEGKELPIIYEDAHLIVVDKPAEFLSVPGIHVKDSVYERILQRCPSISGSVVVHRLDMSTSGLMVLAKSKEVHKHLQAQFIRHEVQKQYIALLEGEVETAKGVIDLPLCLNIHDRPKQMVDFQRGKPAITQFEVLKKESGRTRICFMPKTGRTHQLRMHSAHQLGLNAPIVGDDLYGTAEKRLHLHAFRLTLEHPISKELMTFEAPCPF